MLLLFKVGFSLSSYLKPNYLDAILCLGTQFQLVDLNSSKSKKKSETVRLATSDSSRTPTLETRTASILGTKFLDGLSNINVDLSSIIEDKSKYFFFSIPYSIPFTCYLLKYSKSRMATSIKTKL